MPIYEYRCDNGHQFEVMQRITDDPVSQCEVCQAPVQRVFHPVAVHFKGSGFYNTDYGTAKRKREQSAGSDGDSAKSAQPSDGKAPAKAASASAPGSSAGSSSGDKRCSQ